MALKANNKDDQARDERVGHKIGRLDRKLSAILGSAFFILAAMAAVDFLLPRAQVPRWLTCIAAALVGVLLWANARRTYYKDLSSRDSLTGLNNKGAYEEDVAALIRRKKPFCVFFLDLDRFKLINDIHGHEAGDAVLIDFANSIMRFTGKDECAYRVGGDEFVIVCSEMLDTATADGKADALERAIMHPIDIQGEKIIPNVSVGYARYPTDGVDEHAISAAADAMMYRRKELNHAREGSRPQMAQVKERLSSFDIYGTMLALPRPFVVFTPTAHLELLFANDAFLSLVGASSLDGLAEATSGNLEALCDETGKEALMHMGTDTGSQDEPSLKASGVGLRRCDGSTAEVCVSALRVAHPKGTPVVCAFVDLV